MTGKNIADLAIHCEAKKHAYRQTQDGVVVSFVLHPQEVPEGLALAPLGARYVLALVELNDDETPKEVMKIAREYPAIVTRPDQASPRPDRAKRDFRDMPASQQAGIRCNEPLFRAFLREEHPTDWREAGEDAAACVRLVCRVDSRADLDRKENHKKLVIWHQLNDQFQAWERVGA